MKTNRFSLLAFFTILSVIALMLAIPCANGAAVDANAPDKTNSAPATADTNSPAKVVAIPRSVFEITEKSRDPFFPNSARQSAVSASTNVVPVFAPATFTLKALSGSATKRLALINNRTLAQGEKAEVTTATGKFLIYCEEIKENSVILRTETAPDPVEVFLRKAVR